MSEAFAPYYDPQRPLFDLGAFSAKNFIGNKPFLTDAIDNLTAPYVPIRFSLHPGTSVLGAMQDRDMATNLQKINLDRVRSFYGLNKQSGDLPKPAQIFPKFNEPKAETSNMPKFEKMEKLKPPVFDPMAKSENIFDTFFKKHAVDNKHNITKELNLDPKKRDHMYALMNAVSLTAARIRSGNAMQGSQALIDHKLDHPDRILSMPYWDRVKVLNQNGYARYDESRARYLEDNARFAKEKYNGDLRKLLKLPPHEFKKEVQQFKGIGPLGAEIFHREVAPHMKKANFSPDYTPQQLKEMGVYKEVYGPADGPRLASLKKWPDHWINPQDPKGWLQWYERYHGGRRTDDDERQINRWKSFKARHGASLTKNPTPRRAFALRNWAIDPSKFVKNKPVLDKLMGKYREETMDKKATITFHHVEEREEGSDKVHTHHVDARQGDDIIGHATIYPQGNDKFKEKHVWLDSLKVNKGHRNKGLGTVLLLKALDAHRGNKVMLKAAPFGDKPVEQQKLVNYYKKHGFKPMKDRRVYLYKNAGLTRDQLHEDGWLAKIIKKRKIKNKNLDKTGEFMGGIPLSIFERALSHKIAEEKKEILAKAAQLSPDWSIGVTFKDLEKVAVKTEAVQYPEILQKTQQPTAVIVDRDLKYTKTPYWANRFYGQLTDKMRAKGYAVTRDHHPVNLSPPKADVWIGHNTGADRLKHAPKNTKTLEVKHQYDEEGKEPFYRVTDKMVSDMDNITKKSGLTSTLEKMSALKGKLFNNPPEFETDAPNNRYQLNYNNKHIANLYHKIKTKHSSGMYIEPNYSNAPEAIKLLSSMMKHNPKEFSNLKLKNLNKKVVPTPLHKAFEALHFIEK